MAQMIRLQSEIFEEEGCALSTPGTVAVIN
jgi:hypothetical protein